MSRRLPYAEARARIMTVLDEPRTEPISPDWFPGSRKALVQLLSREGRSGAYGEHFEDLRDPHALHVPGVQARTDSAIVAAIENLDVTVIPDFEYGEIPAFGIGGNYAASDRVTIQGVGLVLVSAYMERGDVPQELAYAASRIAASGTHSTGTAHRIANHLRKTLRNNPEGVR